MPRDKGCGRIHALFPTYEILVIVRAFVLFWSSSVLSSEKEFFLGTECVFVFCLSIGPPLVFHYY
jgi:hypothetical protein